MGNNPGPVEQNRHLDVIIRMTGPIRGDDAFNFKEELDRLIAKYKDVMRTSSGGDLTRPVKDA